MLLRVSLVHLAAIRPDDWRAAAHDTIQVPLLQTCHSELPVQTRLPSIVHPKPSFHSILLSPAGNLAWLCGWVGWLVAAYTNVNAYQAWERAAANAVPFEYGNRWNNYAQAAI